MDEKRGGVGLKATHTGLIAPGHTVWRATHTGVVILELFLHYLGANHTGLISPGHTVWRATHTGLVIPEQFVRYWELPILAGLLLGTLYGGLPILA